MTGAPATAPPPSIQPMPAAAAVAVVVVVTPMAAAAAASAGKVWMTGEGAGAIGWDDACGSRWTAGKHAGTRTRSAFAHSLTTRYIRNMEASGRSGTADSRSLSINLQAALLSALLVHTSTLPLRTSGWRTRTASECCVSRKKGAMAVHKHVSSATCGLAPAVSSISWAKSAKEH